MRRAPRGVRVASHREDETRMRYRTKLTLMFVGGVLLSNALLFTLLYTRSRDLLMAEARSKDKTHVGEVYKATTTDTGQRVISLDETRAEAEMLTDQWGSWMTATAPVRDASGTPVAAVGADLSATEAIENVTDLHHQGALFLVISGTFAVMLAMLLARRATRPLDALKAT